AAHCVLFSESLGPRGGGKIWGGVDKMQPKGLGATPPPADGRDSWHASRDTPGRRTGATSSIDAVNAGAKFGKAEPVDARHCLDFLLHLSSECQTTYSRRPSMRNSQR